MIGIIDYGMGNIGSVLNMLKKIGASATKVSNPGAIREVDRLILPGVGSFDRGMARLRELNLIDVLNERVVEQRIPFLGICLGMQLLSRQSEEGESAGLGWVEARTVRFRTDEGAMDVRIPNMGWQTVEVMQQGTLFQTNEEAQRFYFVHSYHVVCDREHDVAARAVHGIPFTAAIQKDNICGTQFHPEKSHRFGMELLTRFVKAA